MPCIIQPNCYPTHISDANTAFGGSTAAEFATTFNNNEWFGDSSGIPLNQFQGVPILCVSSFGDSIVPKTNQTDLLVRGLGGTPATSNAVNTLVTFTNLPLTPLLWDYGVNGAAGGSGGHGYQCLSTNSLNVTLAFLKACIAIAQR